MVLPGSVALHRSSLHLQTLDYFEQIVNKEPSAGSVCMLFNRIVYQLVEGQDKLSGSDISTILELCTMVQDRRPFPSVLRASLIKRDLDDIPKLKASLNQGYLEKTLLPGRLAAVATSYGAELGFEPGALILLDGFSTNVMDFLLGLPTDIKNNLGFCTVSNQRWGNDEGEMLRTSLGRDPEFANRVKVYQDQADLADLAAKGKIKFMVMGAKVIGVDDNNDLKIINSRGKARFPELASQYGIRIIVVSGRYKIWPQDLFHRFYVPTLEDQEVQRDRADSVTPLDSVGVIVTEDGPFSSIGFYDFYSERFSLSLEEYPIWKLTEPQASLQPIVKTERGFRFSEDRMRVGQVYEVQTDQGPMQFVKGPDKVVRAYEMFEVPADEK